jgi:hypothetical protein
MSEDIIITQPDGTNVRITAEQRDGLIAAGFIVKMTGESVELDDSVLDYTNKGDLNASCDDCGIST